MRDMQPYTHVSAKSHSKNTRMKIYLSMMKAKGDRKAAPTRLR
jgi:hypothetical protein